MGNSSAKIVVDKRSVKLRLEHMRKAASDWTPVTEVLSHKLRNSVDENFEAGGRYDRAGVFTGGTKTWKKRADESPSFLQEGGVLRKSIMPEHTHDESTVSTNIEYAAAQNFGHTYASRGSLPLRPVVDSGVTLPARPFMVVQKQDVEDAKRLGLAHLIGEA